MKLVGIGERKVGEFEGRDKKMIPYDSVRLYFEYMSDRIQGVGVKEVKVSGKILDRCVLYLGEDYQIFYDQWQNPIDLVPVT